MRDTDSFRILFHEYPVIHTIKFNPRDGHSRCEVFQVVNRMFLYVRNCLFVFLDIL